MKPKQPAAIITGTMARPSSPSVRLTALPAPTITNAPKSDEEQAEIEQHVLDEREARGRWCGRADAPIIDRSRPTTGDQRLEREPELPEKPFGVCLVTLR